MRTSTPQPDFFDRRLADAAGLVGTIVNPRHATVIAVGALDVEIIAECSATLLDRGCEDVYGGLTQQANLDGSQIAGLSIRVNFTKK